MKKAIPLLIVLILLGVIFGASSFYKNKHHIENPKNSTPGNTYRTQSKELTDDDIIVQTDDGKYKLYYKNRIVYVTYEDAKLEFNTWSRAIELETPTLHYMDFDKDGENELIIRIIDNFNDVKETTADTYNLFFINPVEKDGKIELNCFSAQQSLWINAFKHGVKEEISQLNNTKKFIQYVMTNKGTAITYDENTGLSKNKYVGYAKTDCDDRKQYYTLSSYYKGVGVYSVLENGKVTLDIQLFVTYEETREAYQIGNIHCDIKFDSSHFYLASDSISFIPLKEYEITDPRDTAQEKWSYAISNLSSSDGSDTVIDSLSAELELIRYYTSDEYHFEYMGGELVNVQSIDFTESGVTLTAKQGYSFNTAGLQTGKYSVLIGDNIDISDTAIINNNQLIIKFDKTYDKEDLEKVTISFG